MFNELLRMHTQWLQHVTHGVNALLPQVPVLLHPVTGLPESPATPAVVTITDETSDPRVALGFPPELLPGLFVGLDPGEIRSDSQAQDMGDGITQLMLRYVVAHENPAVGTRWAGQTLRAATWCLRRLYQGLVPESVPARLFGGVQLVDVQQIAFARIQQAEEDRLVSAALLVIGVQTRDTQLV